MNFITFYLYIISELQFYISFNILLENEVMETSKRRSFLPLIFIIKCIFYLFLIFLYIFIAYINIFIAYIKALIVLTKYTKKNAMYNATVTLLFLQYST